MTMGNAHNPLSEVDADMFARSWADAWNSYDASRISAHYSEDVKITRRSLLASRAATPFTAAPPSKSTRQPRSRGTLTFTSDPTSPSRRGRGAWLSYTVAWKVCSACAHCHYRSTAPGESTVGALTDGD
jgi:hypothetical protein